MRFQLQCLKCLLKGFLVISVVFLLTCLSAFVLRVPLLTGIGGFLVVNDHLQPADMLFVLEGDADTRPFLAAKLFSQGFAPQIATAQTRDTPTKILGLYPNETDVTVNVLKKLGVSGENIAVIPFDGGVNSTFDEAKALRLYVSGHPVQRVIIVTTAFHTRRAKWTFERAFSGTSVSFQIAAASEPEYDETNWWNNDKGMINIADEYLSLLAYLLRGRLRIAFLTPSSYLLSCFHELRMPSLVNARASYNRRHYGQVLDQDSHNWLTSPGAIDALVRAVLADLPDELTETQSLSAAQLCPA